ncbi:hypothetical protein F4703DRAFT_1945490 [Phycomyces blakesleeanus]
MIATSPCVWTQMMRTNACPDSRSYFEMAKPKLICAKGCVFKTDRLASRKTCGQSPSHPHLRRTLINMVCCEGEARLHSTNLSKPSRDKCLQAVFMETHREFSPVPKQYSRNKIRTAKLNMEVKTNNTEKHEKNGIKSSSLRAFKYKRLKSIRLTQSLAISLGWPKAHRESRLGYGHNKNKFIIIIQDYWLRTAKRGYQRELVSVGLYQKGSWCGKPRSGSSSAIWWSNPFVVDPIAASWHIVFAGSLVVYCRWSRIPPAGGQGPFRLVIEEYFAVPIIFSLIDFNNAANSEA